MSNLPALIGLLREQATVTHDLLRRLTTLELLVGTGETRFLGRATTEIDDLGEHLGQLELLRSLLQSRVADELGVAEEAGLRELVAAVDDHAMRRALEEVGTDLRAGVAESMDRRERLTAVTTELEAATATRRTRLSSTEASATGAYAPSSGR